MTCRPLTSRFEDAEHISEEDTTGDYDGSNKPAHDALHLLMGFNDLELGWILKMLFSSRATLRGQTPEITQAAEKLEAEMIAAEGLRSARNMQTAIEPPDYDLVPMDVDVPTRGGGLQGHSIARSKSCGSEHMTLVQFRGGVFHAQESEGSATVSVMRVGACQVRSTVKWRTDDGSALAGVKYVAAQGELIFEKGESSKTIVIKVIDDNKWDSTLEFKLTLLEEGRESCHLGIYLRSCRVKIIDNDMFPTNRFRPQILKDRFGWVDTVPKSRLLFEFFKMNYSNPTVKRGTLKIVCLKQLHNLNWLLMLTLRIHLVDTVLAQDHNGKADFRDEDMMSGNRDYELGWVAAAHFFPLFILHLAEFSAVYFKVGGTTRKTVQANLLRKFLNYDDEARRHTNNSQLIMAMTEHTKNLVENGYCQIFPIAQSAGQLIMIWIFQFGVKQDYVLQDFIFIALFPVCMVSILILRQGRTSKYLDREAESLSDLAAHVDATVGNFRLLADYNRRGYYVEEFEKKIAHANKSLVDMAAIKKNNEFYAPMLTATCAAAYVFIGGRAVLNPDGETSLGNFLATMSVLSQLGLSFGTIYKSLLSMQGTYESLELIAKFMNLHTDVGTRDAIMRQRIAETDKMGPGLKERFTPLIDTCTTDLEPILVQDLSYAYGKGTDRAVQGLSHVDMEMPQGYIYAFVGPRAGGKSTLLYILGGWILPDPLDEKDGHCFIPPHLRVLHITHEPHFFMGTLLQNLTFGVQREQDGRLDRVVAICRRLDIPEQVLKRIEGNEIEDWSNFFSHTQRVLLHIARALISNPEVLCIHKPTMAFGIEISKHVLAVLKEFVYNRGVELDPATAHFRRPRTAIFTAASLSAMSHADHVFLVDSSKGATLVDKDDVTDEMLR